MYDWDLLIYIIAALVTVLIPFFYIKRYRSHLSGASAKHELNIKSGLTEPTVIPVSLRVPVCGLVRKGRFWGL